MVDQSVQDITVDLIYQACDDKLCIFRDEQLLIPLSDRFTRATIRRSNCAHSESVKKLKIELKNADLLTTSSDQNRFFFHLEYIFTRFFGGLTLAYPMCISDDSSDSFIFYQAE